MKPTADDFRLDGNAAAGLLGEIFAFEVTSAMAICESCGKSSAVGCLALYGDRMGAVLRCPGCASVMIVATNLRGEYLLDLRGVRTMRVAAGT